MPEQTMTAGELLAACEQYRTQHMETRVIRGDYDPRWGDDIVRDHEGKPVTEDVLVYDVDAKVAGSPWRRIEQVATDLNDPEQPVFVGIAGGCEGDVMADEKGRRWVLEMSDTVTVRGFSDPDPWTAPTSR